MVVKTVKSILTKSIDRLGRVCLGRNLCIACGYYNVKKIYFLPIDEQTWELIPEGQCNEHTWIQGASSVDSKFRVGIPKNIREYYTEEVVIIGNPITKRIRLCFPELRTNCD